MYFEKFPKIYYDFDTKDADKKLKVLTDITANVRVRKSVLDNITLYDEYDIQEGETPELIAEKFYGNPEYHWIIMLLNERYDYIEDFPVHQNELDEFVSSIYGEENVYNIHHYEKNRIVVEATALLKVPSSTLVPENLYKINDYLLNENTAARITSIDVGNQQLTVSIQRGSFKYNDYVDVWGFRENTDRQTIEYTRAFGIQIPQNAFTLLDTYTAVTNYDHEIRLNEKKRRIKILAPELLQQVINELTDLMLV